MTRHKFVDYISLPEYAFVYLIILALSTFAFLSCSGNNSNTTNYPITKNQIRIPTDAKEITASLVIIDSDEIKSAFVHHVQISPSVVVLDPDESLSLDAVALTTDNVSISDVELVWSVNDLRAGNVDIMGGFVGGKIPGLYNDAISVTAIQNTPQGIKHARASIDVKIIGKQSETTLSHIEILPDSPTVRTGQIYRLRAIGFTEDGVAIPGVNFSWNVADPSLGRVNDLGYLTIVGEPNKFKDVVSVTGVWQGTSITEYIDIQVVRTPNADDFMDVQILPRLVHLSPGDKIRLRAVSLNGLGEPLTGTELRWTLSKNNVGIIDGNGNFVAGGTPGIYAESIRVEAIMKGETGNMLAEDYATVVINKMTGNRPLENVQVVPSSVILPPGSRALLSARGIDSIGDYISNLSITWSVVNPVVGTILPDGQFSASGPPGIYPNAIMTTVTQKIGNRVIERSEYVGLTITGTLSEINITPQIATLSPGRTARFRINGIDENGVLLRDLVVRWYLNADGIGTIDSFGNFTAGAQPGIYNDSIRAVVHQTTSSSPNKND